MPHNNGLKVLSLTCLLLVVAVFSRCLLIASDGFTIIFLPLSENFMVTLKLCLYQWSSRIIFKNVPINLIQNF